MSGAAIKWYFIMRGFGFKPVDAMRSAMRVA